MSKATQQAIEKAYKINDDIRYIATNASMVESFAHGIRTDKGNIIYRNKTLFLYIDKRYDNVTNFHITYNPISITVFYEINGVEVSITCFFTTIIKKGESK